MKTKKKCSSPYLILLMSLLLSKGTTCQMVSFNQFMDFKKVIKKSNQLIEKKKHQKCLFYLKSYNKKTIPKGLSLSYYSNIADCFFYTEKIHEARKYYILAINSGLSILYLENNKEDFTKVKIQDKTFFEIIQSDFDSIANSKNTIEGQLLKNKIIEICNQDQNVRNEFLTIKSKTDSEKKLLQNKLYVQDSINQRVYDSLSLKYQWINKEFLLGEFINHQVVLLHANKEKRYFYINKGYALAKQNLIDWNDVIDLQSFSIIKDAMLNKQKINYIETFTTNDYFTNRDKFDFVCYSLSLELADGGNINDKQKKIEFFFNTTESEKQNNIICFKYIKKSLMKNGVKAEQILYKSTAVNELDTNTKPSTIGIKVL